jgi:hypothetical protein
VGHDRPRQHRPLALKMIHPLIPEVPHQYAGQ